MKSIIYLLLISLGYYATNSSTDKKPITPNQDCLDALAICSLGSYQFDKMGGNGNLKEEFKSVSCLDMPFEEYNSIWLHWKCEKEGVLTFVITPKIKDQDLDFIVFEGSEDCKDIKDIRCMAAGKNIGNEEKSSEPCLGKTGLNNISTDVIEKNGCKYNYDNFLKYINCEPGKDYYLLVNNNDNKDGFSITLEGSVQFAKFEKCNNFQENNKLICSDIFPKPSKENIKIQINNFQQEELKIEILDNQGNNLKTEKILPLVGTQIINLNISQLSGGYYHLRITQKDFTQIKSFIKQ